MHDSAADRHSTLNVTHRPRSRILIATTEDPSHIARPSDAYASSVHRYQHLVAFVANNRYVYTLVIDDPVAATTDGVAIGDPLERVEQVYENATCGVASGVAEEPDYPACSLMVSPNRHVWFGEDPIRSITLSLLLKDVVEPD